MDWSLKLLLLVAVGGCVRGEEHNVCLGTSSKFTYSHRGSDKIYKRMYENCTYVDGNLEIVFLDQQLGLENKTHNYSLSFLSSIREVTGYVLLYALHVESIPLTNLRIIRGQSLLEASYSLYIGRLYQANASSIGVKEVQLPSLHEITNGNVMLENNRDLCFINNIVWSDILTGEGAAVVYKDNGVSPDTASCGHCDASCAEFKGQKHCWGKGPNMCQTLSRDCSPQCDNGCFGTLPSECCHVECAGGCTGPLKTDCWACKNFIMNGTCVANCPPPTIYDQRLHKYVSNPKVQYAYGPMCVRQCPKHLLVEHGACVAACSAATMANTSGHCVPCPGICPKVCTFDEPFLHANNIELLRDCTVIGGTLKIVRGSFVEDGSGVTPPITVSQLSILETVEEITGALSVDANYTGFTSLSFLRNLQVIDGRDLDRRAALLIVGSSLETLGLVSLKEIRNGNVIIGHNSELCYADTINWTRIVTPPNIFRARRNKSMCGLCSAMCTSDGCWGPGDDECVSCLKFLQDGRCVGTCNLFDGFYSIAKECKHCHSECVNSCTGPGADECNACKNVKDGSYCRDVCPSVSYPDSAAQCHPCHANCIYNCTGPNNNLGLGACSNCHVVVYNDSIQPEVPSFCSPADSSCPPRFYGEYTKHRLECRRCHKLCSKCTGPSTDMFPNDCVKCDYYIDVENRRCVPACPEDNYLNSVTRECHHCHPFCAKCHGPTAADCSKCLYVTVYADPEHRDNNTAFNCSETCPDSMPAQIQEKWQNQTNSVCVTVAMYEAKHGTKSGRIAGAVVGGILGAMLLLGVIVVLVVYLRRQWARSEETKLRLHARMTGLDDQCEPLNPSGASPDMAQLRILKDSELRRGDIIGSGAFGTVYKGVWLPANENVKVPVAIKVLNEGCSATQNQELLEEARIMASVVHPNCIRVIAVCMTAQLMLVIPLMPCGCLLDYIRKNRANIGSKSLLNWSTQIAKGMDYLESRGIVHRDLAARNVLVQSANIVKITDFGLSKLLDFEQKIFKAEGGKMPIKWLAIESIQHRIFTHKSDVWSYGVTLWEMFTYGQRPYDNIRAFDVLDVLEKGERLPQPTICTIDVYMIMIKCWMLDADSRPTFKQLAEDFAKMARDPGRYLVIEGDDLMRLPVHNYEVKELLSDVGSSVDGPEDLMTADDYLQPKHWSHGKKAAGPASILDSQIPAESRKKQKVDHNASNQDRKSATSADSDKKRSVRERHKNSRYTSDPCKLNKDEEMQPLSDTALDRSMDQPEPTQPPPRPPTTTRNPSQLLQVDEDDYLKPQSESQPVPAYVDIVDDDGSVPVTATNPEYFDGVNKKAMQKATKPTTDYVNATANEHSKSTNARPFTESQV